MGLLSKERCATVLAEAGLVCDSEGPSLDALVRLAEHRGWKWSIEPTTTYHGRPGKWRALVAVPVPNDGRTYAFPLGSRGVGWSEAEALSKALATALARKG